MNRKKLAYPVTEKDYEHMSATQLSTFLEEQETLLNYVITQRGWRWYMILFLSIMFVIFGIEGKLFGSANLGILLFYSLFLLFILPPIWSCIIYFWIKKRPCYSANIQLLRCILVTKKQEEEKYIERMETIRRIAVKKMKEICDTYNISPTVLWDDLKANMRPNTWYL